MKSYKIILSIVLFNSFVLTTSAQKIGYVNLERVIANMPETRVLQAEIAKLTKIYTDDLKNMNRKFEAKYKKYNAEQASQTASINKQRSSEIQNERQLILKKEQNATKLLKEKQELGLKPILKKAEKAMNDILKDKGLSIILDTSPGKGVLITDGSKSLYNALKVKLGLLPDKN